MLHLRPIATASTLQSTTASPLVLCDRLISLAQEADRAGHPGTASQLVHLAHTVFDEPTTTPLS